MFSEQYLIRLESTNKNIWNKIPQLSKIQYLVLNENENNLAKKERKKKNIKPMI